MIPAAPRESRDPNDLVPSGMPAPAADEVVVLSEPVMTAAGMVEATAANLQRLREVTTALGIVLIFVPVSTVGGPTELVDLLEPDAHDGQAPMGVMSTFKDGRAMRIEPSSTTRPTSEYSAGSSTLMSCRPRHVT